MKGAIGRAQVGKHAKTRTRQAKFVALLAETCNVSAAARAAGVAASTCYRWRTADAGFAALWDAALGIGYDRLEAALLDYALKTVEREVADPAVIAPEEVKGSVAVAMAERTISHADLQFAVGMLARHRAAGEAAKPARKAAAKGAPMPTRAETDAVLKRALDGLARRVKPA